MPRPALLAICVLGLLVASTAGVALAQDDGYVRGEPDLDVYAPEPGLTPGDTMDVTLQVTNDGEATGANERRDMVTTARNVRLDVEDDNVPFTVDTERQALGSIGDGQTHSASITVSVPSDIEAGTYEVDVRLRYSHTAQYAPQSGIIQERSRTVTRTVTLRVADEPRFELVGAGSEVQVGDSGAVDVEVRNVGTEPARDVDVGLESTSPYVSFAEAEGDTARVDALGPGESANVSYEVTIRDGAPSRVYALEGTARFTDHRGIRTTQRGLSAGFSPLEAQRFDVRIEESTLRVGEPGVIRGTVTNDGPVAAEGVTVELGEGEFEPRSRSYAVGDLAVGDSAEFRFRATVPHDADAAPQRLDLTTRYRTATDADRASTDPVRVPVADRRDAVAVSAIEPRFGAGESGTLTLELRNQRDVEIRDVRVTLAVEDPLDSVFRTTVVSSLDSGETDRVTFDLDVDSDAPVSQYPATVDVSYTDPDGEAATVRPAIVAIEVTETDDTVPIAGVLAAIVVLLLVGGGGWWFYGKRFV